MKKLPIIVENVLTICSLADKSRKTKSRILGGRHGDFILIEEPVFRLSERLSVPVEGDLLFSFLHEGEEYSFQSRILKVLPDSLALVEYPKKVKVEKIRKHHRVQVNLEARLYLEHSKEVLEAVINNISEGGCRLSITSMIPLAQNMPCRLEFSLPDRHSVTGLRAKIRSIQYVALKRVTDLGIQFVGPPEQISKVISFCRYCMFFRV